MNFAALISRLFLCLSLLFYKNFFLRVILKKITKLSGTIVIYLSKIFRYKRDTFLLSFYSFNFISTDKKHLRKTILCKAKVTI